jgi:hypothetical protein
MATGRSGHPYLTRFLIRIEDDICGNVSPELHRLFAFAWREDMGLALMIHAGGWLAGDGG